MISINLVVKIEYTKCILITLTPVISILCTVLMEVFLQCFTTPVSLRELDKCTSREEMTRSYSLYFTAVKGEEPSSRLP